MNRRMFLKGCAIAAVALSVKAERLPAAEVGVDPGTDEWASAIWGRDLCVDFGGGLWTEIDDTELANAAPRVEAELRVLGEVVDWDEDKIWHHSRPSPMEFEARYKSREAMTQVGDEVEIVIGDWRVMTACTEAEIDAANGCYLARYQEIGKETV